MSDTKQHFDVVIAGGGLSGVLSAISLAPLTKQDGSKLSIAIVENNALHDDVSLTFDSRVLALSHGSVSYLQSLGVWQELGQNAAPINQIHISDRGKYGKARINADSHQVSALGYVVEMSLLGKALLYCAAQFVNITWFCPDTITSVNWQVSHVDMLLASEQAISAQLLLACDGAQSKCRQYANIASSTKAYEQSALIVNVTMAKPHHHVAYERFTETGPIAMLPLTDGSQNSHKCSVVWTVRPEQAQTLMSLSAAEFSHALTNAFGRWLGTVDKVGQRVVYPLHLVRAKEQVFHRMVLVGNASHTIHPIAGQGFNLGLRDVAALSHMIANQLADANDIGGFSNLAAYAEQRARDHQSVIDLTDSLVTLFSNELPPLVAGRNVGLKVLNYFTPLKNTFVNKTMGY
ncbi:2-octaprenyl-6-methoxyphenyl hydroxylase [Thalassotalea sp. G2M2-11]|uniref:2-octaprenyl-6-methoxyphenyl hydroxylase n=1 Tax=Thalassotalea sp. G2M2-11 TaxID=2787627 RepID=UPI0019D1D212